MLVQKSLFLIFINMAYCENIQISTPSGELLGSTLQSRLGKTIYSFRGIRFAEPPINDLRFKPPVPFQNWTGIYNATTDAPACSQYPTPGINIPSSEDCLFLNVYTTKLPNKKENSRRPVIVLIFPGAYYLGSVSSEFAGPEYFLDQKIVLVTTNYRLATLGFLAVGEESPGNNGLKDQVVAMRWVKKNIESFGGDPSSITLFGASSGASSATLHLVSPMSRGLFHRVIFSSGSAYGIFPIPTQQIDLAKKQARFVGCPDDSPVNIVQCLKNKTADEIVNTFPKFMEFGKDPTLIWGPVIEEDYGQERFLTEHPIKSIETNNFQKVPVLGGITKDEFADRAGLLTKNPTLLQKLNDDFEKYAPVCFCYERGTDRSKKVSRSIRQFYLQNKPLTNDNISIQALGKLYADSLIGFEVNRAVELISTRSFQPVYYYEFTYPTLSVSNVFHGEDYVYFLKIALLSSIYNVTNFPNSDMLETMTTLWANFAKTGNPNLGTKLPETVNNWEPYNIATKKYLDIGKKLVLKNKLYEERYSFWRKLFPISIFL